MKGTLAICALLLGAAVAGPAHAKNDKLGPKLERWFGLDPDGQIEIDVKSTQHRRDVSIHLYDPDQLTFQIYDDRGREILSVNSDRKRQQLKADGYRIKAKAKKKSLLLKIRKGGENALTLKIEKPRRGHDEGKATVRLRHPLVERRDAVRGKMRGHARHNWID